MPTSSFVRNAGILCIAGALIAMAANALSAHADPTVAEDIISYPLSTEVFVVAQILFALTQAMMLMGVLGLVRAHAIGKNRLATIGAWLAVIGIGLTVPGELGFGIIASSKTDSTSAMIVSTFFGLATLVGSLGLILAGIGAIRARVWTSWRRFVPLIAGAYYFVVLLPVFIAVEVGNLWAITGWNICFILLGLALLHHASTTVHETTEPSELDSKL